MKKHKDVCADFEKAEKAKKTIGRWLTERKRGKRGKNKTGGKKV